MKIVLIFIKMNAVIVFQFLDHSTSMLDLPFAARRLFDAKGNEHFSLVNLKRDDLVYISCGESWIDPKLSKEEQQKRFLLSQLSQDVAKIRQYCALRNPESKLFFLQNILELKVNNEVKGTGIFTMNPPLVQLYQIIIWISV